MRRAPRSNRRSRSTRTMPMRWRAMHYTYQAEYLYGWTTTETDYDAKVLGQADRAIALAPDNARAYWVKSGYLMLTQRPNEALGAADTGLAINPNMASLYSTRGFAEVSLGRFEQAKSDAQHAMRLSPRDPDFAFWHVGVGDPELGLRHFDAAIDEYHKAIDAGLSQFHSLRRSGRRLCARRQDGRGKDRLGGGPPPQSQTHNKMDEGPCAEFTALVRRPAKGRAAGRMRVRRFFLRRSAAP